MVVPEPGAERVAAVNVPVSFAGSPFTDMLMGALKPPLTVTFSVTVPMLPTAMVKELDVAFNWKLALASASCQ
jgi:hypothetical protein